MDRSARARFSARQALAALLLAHLLAVVAMAASLRMHHWLHADADDAGHDCAVTLFLHGGGGTAPEPTVVPAFAGQETAVFATAWPPTVFVPTVYAESGVLEHAPPTAG